MNLLLLQLVQMVMYVDVMQVQTTVPVEIPVIAIRGTQIRGGDILIYVKPEMTSFDKEGLAQYIMAAACSNGFTCGCNSGSNNMGSGNTCNCNAGGHFA